MIVHRIVKISLTEAVSHIVLFRASGVANLGIALSQLLGALGMRLYYDFICH